MEDVSRLQAEDGGKSDLVHNIYVEVQRLGAQVGKLAEKLSETREEIAAFKGRAQVAGAFFGLLAGSIPAIATLLWWLLKNATGKQ